MEKYKKYKEAYPNKTDAQIIESLAWELSDKVETIHKLLAEIELLRKPVVMQSVCPNCKSESITKASGSNWCDDCGNVWRQTVA